jgi:glutamyl-tRNA synthetase
LRVALTGTAVSPPIDVTTHLIGRERVLARIDQALRYIEVTAQAAS